MSGTHSEDDFGGFLVEFTPVGSSVKVCAVDPLTGLEAVVVGSCLTPSQTLAAMAVRKLKALLGRADDVSTGQGQAAPSKPAQAPVWRGLIV